MNPLLDNNGTHYCTAVLKFVNGKLHQLWMPADTAANKPEWRLVESVNDDPLPSEVTNG